MKWYAWVLPSAPLRPGGVLLPGVQANGIASSLNTALGIVPEATAAILAVLLGFIIFGGVQRTPALPKSLCPSWPWANFHCGLRDHRLASTVCRTCWSLILRSAVGADAGFCPAGPGYSMGVKAACIPMKLARAPALHVFCRCRYLIRPSRSGRRSRCNGDTLFVCSATAFMH